MRRIIIPYNPRLKILARELRNKSTLSEVILWNCLKGKRIQGYSFHRQKPIDNYIVDFFCPELMLAIEIDGCTHGDKIQKDTIRQKKLESLGVNFLRFGDIEVKKNLNDVVESITNWIKRNALLKVPS